MKALFCLVIGLCCLLCLYSAATDPEYALEYVIANTFFACIGGVTLWKWNSGN